MIASKQKISIYLQKYAHRLELILSYSCLLLLGIIVVAMACQVFFRYALNISLTHTDEISLISLTWLTFLGAAWIYRKQGHISVDLFAAQQAPSPANLIVTIVGHLAVCFIMVVLLVQIAEVSPRALRLKSGTLEMSRFTMHYLPLAISCLSICIFTTEKILEAAKAFPRQFSTLFKRNSS